MCYIFSVKEKKVLFICSGCTCRSPMAVWLMLAKIKEQNIVGVVPECRGLFVEMGAKTHPNAVAALNLLGVPVKKHITPTELTEKDLQSAHMCLVMTTEQKAIIKTRFNKEVKTLAEATDYVEIADPYGTGLNNYIATAKQLDVAIDQLLERYFLEDKR